MKKYYFVFSLFILALLVSGCNKSSTDNKTTTSNTTTTTKSKDELVKAGKELYYKPSDKNNIACADCHSDGTNDSKPLTKIFSSIKGAAKRTSAFLGTIKKEDIEKTATGATNCWAAYEKQKTPLTDNQIASLNAYYESVSKGDEPVEIKYTTFALPAPDKSKLAPEQDAIAKLTANKENGSKLFDQTCAFCHGEKSTIKDVDNIISDWEDGNIKGVTYMTRMGKKAMPFFPVEKLSNQDIADIAAYVISLNKK
ncbi:hypothetical protein BH10BAC5_BH10BAC5_00620 [soil metagenome]